jgi:hypothetical protein
MSDQDNEEKARARKKVVAGLLLTAIVFGWFLYNLLSMIP